MEDGAPSIAMLDRLAASGDLRDRAFAASALELRLGGLARAAPERAALERVYARIRESAGRAHAEVRARLRDRTLDRGAFRARIEETPIDVRDHLVEEILDLAYPPLDAAPRAPGDALCAPSGVTEILFAIDRAELGPAKAFVDLGSGAGKVVLLAALLTGVRAWGLELDARLVSRARSSARSLGLDTAQFEEGDLRAIPIPPADAYYMFIPFGGSADVAARLAPIAAERPIVLFAQALDLRRFSWLRPRGAGCYWLEVYEGGAGGR